MVGMDGGRMDGRGGYGMDGGRDGWWLGWMGWMGKDDSGGEDGWVGMDGGRD